MEIHAPTKPILTVREALAHLVIVTVGILIALSLEGVRESIEHRKLASEARENIAREMEDNARELDTFLKAIPKIDADLDHAHDLAQRIGGGLKELTNESVSLNFSLSSLSTASRTTAEITGAFGYMTYDEVKKYAEVYDLQSKFVRLQDESFARFVSTLGGTGIFADPANASSGEIETMKRTIDAQRGALVALRQLGDELLKAYRKVSTAH